MECKLIEAKISYDVLVECPYCGEQSYYLEAPPATGDTDEDACHKCGKHWEMCEIEQ